jgi:DNA-binding response OmpR family regulator
MSKAISKKEVYEFGPFRLNVVERVLTRGHQIVPLTRKAFDILRSQKPSGAQSSRDREMMLVAASSTTLNPSSQSSCPLQLCQSKLIFA